MEGDLEDFADISPLGGPAPEWRLVRLHEVAVKVGSGATPKGGEATYLKRREEYALIRSQNVFDRYFSEEGLAFISDEQAAGLRNAHVQEGDILLNITGDGVTFGRACLAPTSVLPACVNQHVAIIRVNQNLCEPGFLLSYLTHPLIKTYIESFNAGGSRRAVTKGHIESLVVPMPPLPEQQAIAHILGTLDDKIELNRWMNETLEAIAQAIFQSWFVDFDPVRAKMEGRDPGLPPHLAALFPDHFEDSELGKIPAGWRVAELGEVANIIDCLHSKKPERRKCGRPLLQLWNIRDDGLLDMTDTYYISQSNYDLWTSRMEAANGDCVITNVGRVGAVAQIPEGVTAALGRNMTGIRCKEFFPFPTFLIEALLSGSMGDEIILKVDTGTILDALNVRSIPKLRLTLPELELARTFEREVRPLRARMEQNLAASRTLTALRDTLLPRLLSGELRVRAAERVVAAVV